MHDSNVSLRSRRRAFAALAAVVLAATGCALSPPPSRMEIVNQALPKETRIPLQWGSDAATDAVADDWLQSFNDPVLDRLVAEAMANNLDLRQAAARVEVARQSVVVVGSRLLPQVGAKVGLHGTVADTYAAGTSNDTFYGSNAEYLGVSWELDIWGRLRAQREAATATYEATALDYAFARQSLAATVAKAWYLTIETHRLLEVARESVQVFEELLELVHVRRTAGRVADLDVAEASANLNAANSALRAAEGRYAETRRILELLLGRYPAAELATAPDFAPVPPPVRAGLPGSLLERRPDLVAAERQVLAAFRREEAAKLARLPTLSLGMDGGRLSDGVTSLLRINPWMLHGAIGVSVPIYTGGALTAKIEIATARQAEAIARYGSVILRAFLEVEVALTNESLLADRLQSERRALEDLTEAVRIARIRYTAGAMDMLSVLQLQERQIENRTVVIRLRNAQLANRISLHLVLGGSFDAAPVGQDEQEPDPPGAAPES